MIESIDPTFTGSSTEEWRPMIRYAGKYLISNAGRVKSIGRYRRNYDVIIKHGMSHGMYPTAYLRCEGKRTSDPIHRLVAEAFIGPRPTGFQINHIDGNKCNNRVENLEYVSASDNQKHAFRIGLASMKGERHTRHKLTDQIVIEMRRLRSLGETYKNIGKLFGVTKCAASMACRGIRWSHIPDNLVKTEQRRAS